MVFHRVFCDKEYAATRKVEMGLDLSSVRYICFDEADRLFEMGFASQLAEILHALPTSRQTLLFSATLPKSLVEFARAGLQEPKLIRLDAESKISPDLKSAYFTIKSGDRDGALLYLLEQVIKVPTGETDAAKARKEEGSLSVGAKRIFRHSRRSAYTEWDVQLVLAGRAGPTAFVDTSIFRICWTYNCSLANGCLLADPTKTRISPKISLLEVSRLTSWSNQSKL